jgi:hypothetical protein
MHKLDKILDWFKCGYCQKQFEEPVIVPCLETICRKDLISLLNGQNSFQCPFCNNEHKKPIDDFHIDRRTQKMMDLEINKLNFEDNISNFAKCKNELSFINEKIADIDKILNDPNNYIYEYFEQIINQVDSQREYLKQAIDIHSEEMINNIKQIRKDHKIFEEKDEIISQDLNLYKESLSQLKQEFDVININETKIKEILESSEKLKIQTVNKLNELKYMLLENKSYKFDPIEINISSFFGDFFNEVNYFYKTLIDKSY